MKSSNGFTLIEMLASVVIMGVLVTAVLGPLANLFGNTKVSGQKLQKTTQSQNVLEFVKGQWKPYPRVIDDTLPVADANYRQDLNRGNRAMSRQRYDSTCYDTTGLNVPTDTTYAIAVNAVNRDGTVGPALTLRASTNCAGVAVAALPPLMKRITVTVSSPNAQSTVFSTFVARP